LSSGWCNFLLLGFPVPGFVTFSPETFEFGGVDVEVWRAAAKARGWKLNFQIATDTYAMSDKVQY